MMLLIILNVDDHVKISDVSVSAFKISPIIEHTFPAFAFLYDTSEYNPGDVAYKLTALFPNESPMIAKTSPTGPQQ